LKILVPDLLHPPGYLEQKCLFLTGHDSITTYLVSLLYGHALIFFPLLSFMVFPKNIIGCFHLTPHTLQEMHICPAFHSLPATSEFLIIYHFYPSFPDIEESPSEIPLIL
jgi:hypothetical protein